MASSAIPGALPPVEIDGRLLFDGLASANLPALPAVRRGAGSVVVLDTGGRDPGEVNATARRVMSRLSAILATAQRRDQLRTPPKSPLSCCLLRVGWPGTWTSATRCNPRPLRTRAPGLSWLGSSPSSTDHWPGLYADPDHRGVGDALGDIIRPVAMSHPSVDGLQGLPGPVTWVFAGGGARSAAQVGMAESDWSRACDRTWSWDVAVGPSTQRP